MKLIILLLVSIVNLGSLQAVAQQIEVTTKVNQEINIAARERGYRESVQRWCRDRLRILRRYSREAQKQLSYGRYKRANDSLMKGLEKAQKNLGFYNSTFTAKSIQRALSLIRGVAQTDNNIRTLNHFLFEYYRFINFVSNELDSIFAQRRNCHFCDLEGNTSFERNYIKFAKWQIKMMMKKLVMAENRSHGTIYYPIGEPEVFISIFSKTAQNVAQDLEESIFFTRFSCIIDDLHYISDRLSNYREEFNSNYDAVQFAGYNGTQVLKGFKRCRRHSRPYHPPDYDDGYGDGYTRRFNALRGNSLILYSGSTRKINLRRSVEIKKLIISAEGVYNDAMFEVVVNGEIKGTVYVPGRDPIYHVTIEDTASEIKLVSRFGKVKIKSLIVIAHPFY